MAQVYAAPTACATGAHVPSAPPSAPPATLETGPHHTDLPDVTRSADPRPTPPEKPLPTDCCGSGCAVCVNDTYQEELDDYEARLAAWRVRNPGLDAADRRATGD